MFINSQGCTFCRYFITAIENNLYNNHYSPSGIVVIYLCKLQTHKRYTGWTWWQIHFHAINQNLPNIVDTKLSYFGSTGFYYSYGNKGNYGIKEHLSVGQYSIKIYDKKMDNAILNAKLIEEMCAQEIKLGLDGLMTVILELKLFSSCINSAYVMNMFHYYMVPHKVMIPNYLQE